MRNLVPSVLTGIVFRCSQHLQGDTLEGAPCLQNESVDEASKDKGKDRYWTDITFH